MTAFDMRISDWRSDVCSSALLRPPQHGDVAHRAERVRDVARQAADIGALRHMGGKGDGLNLPFPIPVIPDLIRVTKGVNRHAPRLHLHRLALSYRKGVVLGKDGASS